MPKMLSNKPIPPHERLIFALDVPDQATAKERVNHLGEAVLFMSRGYFDLIDWLLSVGKKVFVDLKFFDVPETVARTVRQLKNYGVHFTTVHGNDRIPG
jgi:orotidine-5'-phosphate decarboxylase